MTRFLALAVGTVGALFALLVGAPAAHADAVDDAVAALRSAPVYVGASSPGIDEAAVRSAIGSQQVKIAVLPEEDYGSVSKAFDAAERIGAALAPDPAAGRITVGVVSGRSFSAASSAYCGGSASSAAQEAIRANLSTLRTRNDVTSTVQDFVAGLRDRPLANTAACGTSSAKGRSDIDAASSDGGSALPWVLGLGAVGVVGAGGVGAYAMSRRKRRLQEMEGRRAEVLSLYDRLGADVQNLHGDDPVVRQALADAAERYTATGSQLSQADTHQEYDVARRTALEGLQAARTARLKLGLDPGPELPPIAPATGEQLSAPREVAVAGKSYQGYPEYTPGAPYYYGGGGGVPGGWYGFPFWETVLLGSVLSGGFGGGFGGGGFDAGYDRGYDAGRDDNQDSGGYDGGNDGGNGGGFGGGDWGGGGGGFGGGDWGGGGGGFGGGDWGGGGGGGGDSGGGSW